MYDWRLISDTSYRISLAEQHAPRDIFTKLAIISLKGLTSALVILMPIQIITTALGGCVIAVTFGLFLLLLNLIWWPFLALLLSTSWLWLHAWYMRPILLLPGIVIAVIAVLYVMLAPDPERDSKYTKLALAGDWPLSWYIIKPPIEYYKSL